VKGSNAMTTAVGSESGMTGILTGSGHDQLRVTVPTGAVPHHAPADLEGSVMPVYDDDGHLYDWRMDPSHADHVLQAQDFQKFAAWRRGFATERFLGERVLLRTFLKWAAQKCDVSALQVLKLDHAHLDYHRTLQLDRQLGKIRVYLDQHPATGFGLFSPNSGRPIRGFVPAADPVVILALGSDSVSLAEDGLHLHTGGTDVLVSSWAINDGRVTANGELDLGVEPAARLLRIVGRQAQSIEVKPCSVGSLLAPLLSFGKEAADIAGSGRTGLYLRSTWS